MEPVYIVVLRGLEVIVKPGESLTRKDFSKEYLIGKQLVRLLVFREN
jgi:hypothetical protein